MFFWERAYEADTDAGQVVGWGNVFEVAENFSAFLGVPVTIHGSRFSTEMEFGTRVRGSYEVLAPPQLVAIRWDFDDEVTPLPGRQAGSLAINRAISADKPGGTAGFSS